MAETIFREQTDEEKRDFTQLRERGSDDIQFKERFRLALEIEESKFRKQLKPFCARCARIDFEDKVNKAITEMERKVGYARSNINIEIPDFEPYGRSERFQMIKEQDAMEPVGAAASILAGTIVRQIKIGVHRDYKCRERGCGISIFISNEVLTQEKKK